MTRVLVVDDSQFIRTVIDNALTEAGYEVQTATNGADAVDAVAEYDPDVVTMDVQMPGVDGIEAVERIMTTNPTVVLMLSAYTERGAEATLDALERGAAGFVHKPDGSDSRNVAHLADEVVERVDELADANVSSLALARVSATAHATRSERSSRQVTAATTVSATGSTETITESQPEPERRSGTRFGVPGNEAEADSDAELATNDAATREFVPNPTIVLGASTGGPKIIERTFERLPIELGAKLVVVQHMPAGFTDRFAARLDSRSEYDVREAGDGDRLRPGEAVIAPGDHHLEVAATVGGRLRLCLDDGEPRHGVRPAIDVTMESAAERVDDPLCGVVLTGMGRDGAAGIEAISAAGGHTVAQDEATSPVFGIPGQAIRTGHVDDVVPADGIADALVDVFSVEGETDD
ncbi:chemotaxis response regulator protein-glutamate methylesterase [Natronococcus pandeyae]|uniref:Protein-glutamate methylesterase/protein-glutamine glutaminase n=1 Tax=Natronococcus pandeyae TaxID=2055836 RepID=A0A8J8Q063_9EURY|nr:chemotaxis-specific protein-glutamate methyltransferase CheB [Natronococcus pandeyae]TYL37700.1 chemotaxis response regulator protein-glutamate methylesterase [Natronococcus pandeyae]